MKNIFIKSFAVLSAGLMLGSCEENAIEDFNEPASTGAYIKFVHAAPDAPAVNYYLGSTKISAVPANTAGEVQGIVFTGGNSIFPSTYGYANVAAGNQTLQALGLNNAVVASSSPTLADGEFYTVYLLGESSFENYVVEDEVPALDYSKAYLRFVNILQDDTHEIDAVLVKEATSESAEQRIPLGDNVAFKEHSEYVAFEPNGSYVVEFTVDGETTVLQATSSFSPIAGRVYSLVLRGDQDTSFGTNLYRDR
ncbi:DUF4397 domain-containing protein [Pontibacter actiniarum]|uniref:DUF4397 domain-containing protein n=1 Tax=Pontibacter actiniarum TaxID=323450 RepID=A0A1X9YRM1_9BACT|nr:DUF4397 domain-containing protein [Pontibacter actiniarum]ARS35519.1 hypothetical protein CA264_08760 [Pontibacter actiniarum]